MGRSKEKPVELLEKVRDELIATGLKFKQDKIEKNGSMTFNDLNALTNILRSSAYVEQVRYQEEKGLDIKVEQFGEFSLSEADKKRLDKIVKLLEKS